MTIRKLFSKAAALVLSLCMIAGAAGFEPGKIAVGAAEEQVYGDFLYVDKGDYIEITGLIPETVEAIKNAKAEDLGNGNWGIDIPEYIYDKPVTSIGTKAFNLNITFSSDEIGSDAIVVEIPRFVNYIADDAFTPNLYNGNIRFIPSGKVIYTEPGKSIECPAVKTLFNFYRLHGLSVNGIDENGNYVEQTMDKSFGLIGKSLQGDFSEDKSGKNVIYDPVKETIEVSEDTPGAYEYSTMDYATAFEICNVRTTTAPFLYNLGYTPSTQEDTTKYFPNSLNDILDESNATSYNPELAYMLCVISQNAYYRNGIYWDYRKLGFNNIEIKDYDTTYDQADNCGYVIGYQDLPDGTREFLITVRGTASDILTEFYKPPFGDPAEWFSDFNMGFTQLSFIGDYPKYHHGFYVAAQRVLESLKKYNDGNIRTDKVRYVLTGHSRGAAVSNLVSRALIEAGVIKSNLYSYNFACPDVAIGDESQFLDSRMSSIFNLNCARDLVGQVPGVAGTYLSRSSFRTWIGDVKYWGKFGRTFFWDADWDSSLPADVFHLLDYHPCDTNYIPYFSWEYPLSDFKTYEEMMIVQGSNVLDWSTPKKVVHTTIRPQPTYISASVFDDTTVKITDKDGNVVGTVKDNSISIESGSEDKIQANFVGESLDIAVSPDSGYQISVESEAPVNVVIAQEDSAYNSINNAAVYSAPAGSTTIDIKPDVPASATPVTGDGGKAVVPDKTWNLGDINSDGQVSVSDVVLLQKWILAVPGTQLKEWTAGDIYCDNILNVFDLCLLKRMLLEQ